MLCSDSITLKKILQRASAVAAYCPISLLLEYLTDPSNWVRPAASVSCHLQADGLVAARPRHYYLLPLPWLDSDSRQALDKGTFAGKWQEGSAPVNEGGGGSARQELGVAQHIFQEQDVGLHAADVELVQSTLHLLDRMQIGPRPHDHLPGSGEMQSVISENIGKAPAVVSLGS